MTDQTTQTTNQHDTIQDPHLWPVDSARVAEWLHRARTAGHPVIAARPGRFRPLPIPALRLGTPPNDVLDILRERARAQMTWVHVAVPTAGDLLALAEALRPPTVPRVPAPRRWLARTTPARRGGHPVRAWAGRDLGTLGPVAISDTREGVTVHVLEIPVPWLDAPVTVVRRPARAETAPPVGTVMVA